MRRRTDPHGRAAASPSEIPRQGRRDVLTRVRAEMKRDHMTLLSAGVAFYALLALVPALVAVISIYGSVSSPDEVRRQILDALSAAPAEVRDLVSTQLQSIASSSGAGTVIAAVVGILAALWSASSGIDHLVDALNAAYDEDERRSFVRRKATSLAFTIAAVLFVIVAFVVIALLPSLVARTGLGVAGRVLVGVFRWVLLLGGMQFGLAVLYRYGPDRATAEWRWVSPGAAVAAGLWIVGSLAFSLYTANFAEYNDTYGSLGAVVVLMLWLFLTASSVLLGAEINAELERQTVRDTTTGRPRALGTRGAYAADTVGATADEVQRDRRGAAVDADTEVAPAVSAPVIVATDTVELPMVFRGIVGAAARVFGVRRDRAHAVITATTLTVRYGGWVVHTPLDNVRSVEVTGPYSAWKVAGPPHLSFSDRGLTFATNRVRGLCVTFWAPVRGIEPTGVLLHPGLTFTVDPEVAGPLLRERCRRLA